MPCRARAQSLCFSGCAPSRVRNSGFHAPKQVPMDDQGVGSGRDCGMVQGCHGAAEIPARVRSRVGRTGGDRRQEPELGRARHHRKHGHRTRAACRTCCCGDSSDASANPDPSASPQHKSDRNMRSVPCRHRRVRRDSPRRPARWARDQCRQAKNRARPNSTPRLGWLLVLAMRNQVV